MATIATPDAATAGATLERLGTWVRRVTPRLEWNAVALSVLSLLSRRGPQRVGELLAAEQISQPGMTSLVGRMAAAGLVTREADPTDGRATLVTVTPAGKAYLDRVHDARAAVIAERVRRLPRPDQQAIAGALNAIDALTRPVLEGDQLP